MEADVRAGGHGPGIAAGGHPAPGVRPVDGAEAPFGLHVAQLDEEIYVTVAGACDVATVASLGDCLDEVVGPTGGRRSVVVDLGDCSVIDPATVSLLVGAHRRMERQGRSLVVANARPGVREVLRSTGADRHLDLAE